MTLSLIFFFLVCFFTYTIIMTIIAFVYWEAYSKPATVFKRLCTSSHCVPQKLCGRSSHHPHLPYICCKQSPHFTVPMSAFSPQSMPPPVSQWRAQPHCVTMVHTRLTVLQWRAPARCVTVPFSPENSNVIILSSIRKSFMSKVGLVTDLSICMGSGAR